MILSLHDPIFLDTIALKTHFTKTVHTKVGDNGCLHQPYVKVFSTNNSSHGISTQLSFHYIINIGLTHFSLCQIIPKPLIHKHVFHAAVANKIPILDVRFLPGLVRYMTDA